MATYGGRVILRLKRKAIWRKKPQAVTQGQRKRTDNKQKGQFLWIP